jgi:hypothetical protein
MNEPAHAAGINVGRVLEIQQDLPAATLRPQYFLDVPEVPWLLDAADLALGPDLTDPRRLLGTQSESHGPARTLGTVPTAGWKPGQPHDDTPPRPAPRHSAHYHIHGGGWRCKQNRRGPREFWRRESAILNDCTKCCSSDHQALPELPVLSPRLFLTLPQVVPAAASAPRKADRLSFAPARHLKNILYA